MPQEFQILRCCECEKFQVHHVKKAKKWECKVCGQKQSLKRAFFIGSSRDCRINVQELNFQAGEQKMMQKLDESCNSQDIHNENHSLELENADSDFPTENDWVDQNEWADENEWIDEDDGFDENPSDILDSSSNGNLQNDLGDELPRKKQRCESYSEFEASGENAKLIQLTKKTLENQSNCFSSPVFKSLKDMVPSKSIELANDNLSTEVELANDNSSTEVELANDNSSTEVELANDNSSTEVELANDNSSTEVELANDNSSTEVELKIESKPECDSVEDKEGNSISESANYKSYSILTPTQGFQLILNAAKKRRTHFSFDVDL